MEWFQYTWLYYHRYQYSNHSHSPSKKLDPSPMADPFIPTMGGLRGGGTHGMPPPNFQEVNLLAKFVNKKMKGRVHFEKIERVRFSVTLVRYYV